MRVPDPLMEVAQCRMYLSISGTHLLRFGNKLSSPFPSHYHYHLSHTFCVLLPAVYMVLMSISRIALGGCVCYLRRLMLDVEVPNLNFLNGMFESNEPLTCIHPANSDRTRLHLIQQVLRRCRFTIYDPADTVIC